MVIIFFVLNQVHNSDDFWVMIYEKKKKVVNTYPTINFNEISCFKIYIEVYMPHNIPLWDFQLQTWLSKHKSVIS